MSDLHTLFYGRRKAALRPIMTDTLKKVNNYKKAREASSVPGFHEIRPAEEGADIKKPKRATIGGNRPSSVPRITRHGVQVNGWIGRGGFNTHT